MQKAVHKFSIILGQFGIQQKGGNISNKYFTISFIKDGRQYIGTATHGEQCTLQDEESDVKLTIPGGLNCSVIGHIHTHTQDILKQIPEGECLIAPVPDYTSVIKHKQTGQEMFEIKLKHCVKDKNDLKKVRVRTGNIHKNIPFTNIPQSSQERMIVSKYTQSYFQVDDTYITIYTEHFCQFLCTLCDVECKGEIQALLFGSHFMANERTLVHMSKLYLCGPLFSITDFKKVSLIISSLGFTVGESVTNQSISS